jgi:two-component system chemotaxis sensor kinase CheA
MELAADITAEDLAVFLQEANEQLQALDEDIVRLEREKENPDLLQEIFRIAHTLKGSSAMFGYRLMTDLAHAMESLLDKVRKKTVLVTTQVADALLHSLDLLQILKNDLANSTDSHVNIAPVVAELEEAAAQTVPAQAGSKPAAPARPAPAQVGSKPAAPTVLAGLAGLALDNNATAKVQLAQAAGQKVYLIQVALNRETSWAAVRCFQVLQTLSLLGEVISSIPSAADIEAEKVEFQIQVVLSTEHDEETVRKPLTTIFDIVTLEVGPYSADDAPSLGVKPSAETPAHAVSGDAPQAPAQGQGQTQAQAQTQTVRIDVERLDRLMNTIGELVIDRTRILQIGKMLESRYKEDDLVHALGETSSHVVKVVDDLQEEIMKARMLPVGTVFSGFPRMVRDLAQKIGKKVDFSISGQETEIDRTVIERIRDPLVHMLRNAVDHGMETPEQRQAAGKPETGTLRLAAFQEHGYIVVTVEDDGRGIDAERLRQSAVKKGLMTAEAAARLTDSEAIDLIFLPGFSTAEKTTDVSGRGVGLDIVKTNIESINGFVNLETKVGKGTKFILRLPLTLATIQALLFRVGQTVYAVPLIFVLEAVIAQVEEVSTIQGQEVIRVRDAVVPLLRLRAAFLKHGQKTPDTILADGPPEPDPSQGQARGQTLSQTQVVVVRLGERFVGLAVDFLMELQEVMAKSLGSYMGQVKGIAGVSILGDGQVVLILDVPTLISTYLARGGPKLDRGSLAMAGAGRSGGPG